MAPVTLYKTIHQYNKETVSPKDMWKLQEIAMDYSKVKNYVYQRYGGIKSLSKIYPGYTVQNEMTHSGLRGQLGMPSVYFYLVVFDALGDIKAQWAQAKNRVLLNISRNQRFTPEDRHYMRFVLKINPCLDAILSATCPQLPNYLTEQYSGLCAPVDSDNLNRYLGRQIRRQLRKLHTDKADGFSASERAYRYGDHGIYIATKEKRNRIFLLLTDGNCYKKQIYIRLYPELGKVKIEVPVIISTKEHRDYDGEIGISTGIFTMMTTDAGHTYGEQYGEYHKRLTDYVRSRALRHDRTRPENVGRKKYAANKKRLDAGLHDYINQELNRLIRTEKPKIIYVARLPQVSKAGINREINYSVGLWQKGYIRKRLIQKCREQSIQVTEVFGKNISRECSSCGETGMRSGKLFTCPFCGLCMNERTNAAKNVLKRGDAQMRL